MEQVKEAVETDLTLEQIEERMHQLITQTKLNFIEMGKLLSDAKKIHNRNLCIEFSVDDVSEIKNKIEGRGFIEYAIKKFKLSNRMILDLITIYDKFQLSEHSSLNTLPYSDVSKMRLIKDLPMETVEDILEETFIFKDKEIKGKDLSTRQLKQVVSEKKLLQEQLETIQNNIDDEIEKGITKGIKIAEAQLVNKLTVETKEANLKIQKAEELLNKLEAEKHTIGATKKVLDNDKREHKELLRNIEQLKNELELLDKNKSDIMQSVKYIKELSGFIKMLDDVIYLTAEFENDLYIEYLQYHDIKKYIIPTIKNALNSITRFSNYIDEKIEGVVCIG